MTMSGPLPLGATSQNIPDSGRRARPRAGHAPILFLKIACHGVIPFDALEQIKVGQHLAGS